MLKGKKIVLGVTGGIAAYKAADLKASRLKKSGAKVFIHHDRPCFGICHAPYVPNPVPEPGGNRYVYGSGNLGCGAYRPGLKKADLFIIAPAGANVIGKVAHGIADDMLTTTVMATRAPVLFAPAMNTQMYLNPVVQRNIRMLKELGYHFEDPGTGRLACADVGVGKMAEPQILLEKAELLLNDTGGTLMASR